MTKQILTILNNNYKMISQEVDLSFLKRLNTPESNVKAFKQIEIGQPRNTKTREEGRRDGLNEAADLNTYVLAKINERKAPFNV